MAGAILRRDALWSPCTPLLSSSSHLSAVDRQPVHPGAVRRAFKSWLRILAVPTLVVTPFLTPFLGWWTPLAALPPVLWAWFGARGEIAGLRWALTRRPRPAAQRLARWRRLVIVPIDRVQTVTLHSSPWIAGPAWSASGASPPGAARWESLRGPLPGRRSGDSTSRRASSARSRRGCFAGDQPNPQPNQRRTSARRYQRRYSGSQRNNRKRLSPAGAIPPRWPAPPPLAGPRTCLHRQLERQGESRRAFDRAGVEQKPSR